MAKPPTPAGPAPHDEPDPSMDDILASIRRILDEDPSAPAPKAENVLVLDSSMLVEDGAAPATPPPAAAPDPDTGTVPSLAAGDEMEHTAPVIDSPTPPPTTLPPVTPPPVSREAVPLVAPEAAAAAASSVGALMRTLAAERGAVVSRSNVTIEDLVREEIKPLLKQWLDTHLPPMVERLVRAEIERVVARDGG